MSVTKNLPAGDWGCFENLGDRFGDLIDALPFRPGSKTLDLVGNGREIGTGIADKDDRR